MKKLNLVKAFCACCLAAVTGVSQAVLLGLSHTGPDGESTLVEINPLTGSDDRLIGYTGFERCSAMDFDDIRRKLFATCERMDGSDTHVLVEINPSNGKGTEVGPTGIEFFRGGNDISATMPDISFRPSDGVLFGWNFPSLDRNAGFFGGLSTLDLETGAATLVGYATGVLADDGSGLAFLPSGDLLYGAGEDPGGSTCTGGLGTPDCDAVLHLVDETAATASLLATLSFPTTTPGEEIPDPRDPRPNAMEFDPVSGNLYASVVYGFGFNASGFLATIDSSTGDVDLIGSTAEGLDALAVINPPTTASCDIRLNRATYVDQAVSADIFRLANTTGDSVAVEMKVWFGVPGSVPLSVVNIGADGSLVLPAGAQLDLGPLVLIQNTSALPNGSYEFSCRLLDPVTGELLTEDRNLFEIKETYEIGDTGPAGGIVFYTTGGGLQGLEAAPIDQVSPFQPGAEWGCQGTLIDGADGTAIGTGAQNTADILAGCTTPGIAAALADAYTLNGFSDWYLPSIDELFELYSNRAAVGGFFNMYWSSSEFSASSAWYWQFNISGQTVFDDPKSDPIGVRAIRAF